MLPQIGEKIRRKTSSACYYVRRPLPRPLPPPAPTSSPTLPFLPAFAVHSRVCRPLLCRRLLPRPLSALPSIAHSCILGRSRIRRPLPCPPPIPMSATYFHVCHPLLRRRPLLRPQPTLTSLPTLESLAAPASAVHSRICSPLPRRHLLPRPLPAFASLPSLTSLPAPTSTALSSPSFSSTVEHRTPLNADEHQTQGTLFSLSHVLHVISAHPSFLSSFPFLVDSILFSFPPRKQGLRLCLLRLYSFEIKKRKREKKRGKRREGKEKLAHDSSRASSIASLACELYRQERAMGDRRVRVGDGQAGNG